MAKQKVVVKVTMKNKKTTSKAIELAVRIHGVESVALEGTDKEHITVTGEGIDSAQLTKLLRKKVGYAELVSVGLIEEPNPAEPASERETEETPVWVEYPYPLHCFCNSFPLHVVHEFPSNSCIIM